MVQRQKVSERIVDVPVLWILEEAVDPFSTSASADCRAGLSVFKETVGPLKPVRQRTVEHVSVPQISNEKKVGLLERVQQQTVERVMASPILQF